MGTRTMISKRYWLFFVILGLFTLSGCGGPKVKGLVSVQGTVTYKGEPLEGAAICFAPEEFETGDRLATGKTDAQGKFELRTIGELGVLPGEYVVVVIKNEVSSAKHAPSLDSKASRSRPKPPEIKSLIPKRYNDPKTSRLSVTVEKSGLKDWRLEIVD